MDSLEYYVILPHVSDASVLLVRDGAGWTLPHFTPDITDFRMAHHINAFVKAQYGAESVVGSTQGLSVMEVEGLLSLSMKMKLLCANLSGFSVPHTLVHGDLGGNILVTDDRYIFFDWTDVCIAHPFFDMATIIQDVFAGSVLEHEADVRTRLRDAYLEPWTTYEPMERLIHAFELSTSLGALHQAMSYMWLLMNVEENARWELESGLLLWLRRLLQLLPPRE